MQRKDVEDVSRLVGGSYIAEVIVCNDSYCREGLIVPVTASL